MASLEVFVAALYNQAALRAAKLFVPENEFYANAGISAGRFEVEDIARLVLMAQEQVRLIFRALRRIPAFE